ncbi:MAG TPA: mechanosensitive ion channel domain-containing protein [Candidatus Acidoferrales bacterium]|nr:mechanosensitive ion channel domain-containing protein [Candidatus Acidoferrales bacterium]
MRQLLITHWQVLLWSTTVLGGAILLAFLARFLLFVTIKRMQRGTSTVLKQTLIHHSEGASRWIFPLLGILAALPAARLPARILQPVQHLTGLGLIAAFAWLVILFSEIIVDVIAARHRIDVTDNLLARKVQTQLRALHRVVVITVIVVAVAVMLMTFPAIRQIGTSLLASAGLAGLVVGMAMKPTISSLIAGVQIALTEPIRIEDVVVVEGEWGWIEEINSTYVVVRIWDLRRLVLPLTYFIEHSFQNWTRTSADLLAAVVLWMDYTVPVEAVRGELRGILESTDKWKGHVCVLQVTDASEHAVQIRALMDARDSSTAWDLRCYVREKLIQYLQERYPESLPRLRTEFRKLALAGSRPIPGAEHAS